MNTIRSWVAPWVISQLLFLCGLDVDRECPSSLEGTSRVKPSHCAVSNLWVVLPCTLRAQLPTLYAGAPPNHPAVILGMYVYYYSMSIISFSATLSECELSLSSTIAQSVNSIQTTQSLTLRERFTAWHRGNVRGLRRLFTRCVRPTASQWRFEHHKDWILFSHHMSDVCIFVHCDVNNCYVIL